MLFAIGTIGSLFGCFKDEKAAEAEKAVEVEGPLPKRFQGAYNSLGCGSMEYIDGLVTVGDKDAKFPLGSFNFESVVSETPTSVTLRGYPTTMGGREAMQTFTISFAPVGGMASLDGDEYHRCSQY